jgi:Na+-transporting NADH:ubiquinone oxidoreductase subunit B
VAWFETAVRRVCGAEREAALDLVFARRGAVTRGAPHVRDAANLAALARTVALALLPCVLFALYNVGYQAADAVARGATPLADWRTSVFALLGGRSDPHSPLSCALLGGLYFFPVLAVAALACTAVEVATAVLRGRERSEGTLIAALLFALVLPPAIPLWQVALGAAFGILFGQEVYGGRGRNIFHPVLVGRVFLVFAYPAQISGDPPWIAASFAGVDGFSGATPLVRAISGVGAIAPISWWDAFLGRIPGSMGETSTLACLLGAAVLVAARLVSWRVIAGALLGTLLASSLLNAIGSASNALFALPFHWHVVLGGWAFGTAFLATDPFTTGFTDAGRWLCGFAVGVLVVLIRVLNPAYPEGMMFAILFANMLAPLFDSLAVRANIRRREARRAA